MTRACWFVELSSSVFRLRDVTQLGQPLPSLGVRGPGGQRPEQALQPGGPIPPPSLCSRRQRLQLPTQKRVLPGSPSFITKALLSADVTFGEKVAPGFS